MKIMIYPFFPELSELASQLIKMKKYDDVIPVSPKSFGYENICDNIDIVLPLVDTVLLEYKYNTLSQQDYINIINKCINVNKKVLITESLSIFINEFINDVDMKYIEILGFKKNMLISDSDFYKNLFNIPIPVIVICSIGNQCNKFQISIELNQFFQQNGYIPYLMSSKEYCRLLDVDPLPSFLFENINIFEKIKSFNRYVYNMSKNKDVIIITIPGGIMQKNPYIFDEFGEMAFIISNSIRADICILSIYTQKLNNKIIDEYVNICKYKYNFPVKYINISNVNYHLSIEDKKEKYIRVPYTVIDSIINDFYDVRIFNSLNPNSMDNISKKILQELQENL